MGKSPSRQNSWYQTSIDRSSHGEEFLENISMFSDNTQIILHLQNVLPLNSFMIEVPIT